MNIPSDPPLRVGHSDADYYVIVCCFRVDMVSLRYGSALIFDFRFSLLDFRHRLKHRGLHTVESIISDRRGSVLHCLIVRGLYWRFTVIVSLSQGLIVRAAYFLSLDEKVQQFVVRDRRMRTPAATASKIDSTITRGITTT